MKVNEEMALLPMFKKAKMTSDGLGPIVIRITIEGVRREISLGRKTSQKMWNQKAGCVKGASQDALLHNQAIEIKKIALRKLYDQLKGENDFVSAEMVKQAHDKKPEKSKGLMEVVNLAVDKIAKKVEKKLRAEATLTKWKTTRDHATGFLKNKFQTDDIPLNKLNAAFAEDFVDYLMVELGISQNVAHWYLKKIRGVVTNAVDNGWVRHNPLNTYVCSYIDPERDILDEAELLTLLNKKMPNERLESVKDAYLFMCFTGFAYKDTSKLTPDNIVTHFDGDQWVVKNRQKVTTTICKENVPLLPQALEIITKYKEDKYCKAKNVLLPINSNQKYNAYLKEIATICDIKKELTTHTARHTFATTVTLANGVPLETVSAMLGHKLLKTTQIYAKIVASKVSADMKDLKERLIVKMPTVMLKNPGEAA
ncbi:site-specific integrase [Mucilaginibacter sp. Mucisp86]|uniref:site-specific integrase n=1 Tax=Mucilaginibacter sp. Mucisp86 TaxID=3243060 RepID=UPI0039B55876